MKKFVFIAALVLVISTLVFSGGCRRVDLSGDTVTKDFTDITGFTRVDVSSAFYVDISRSDNFSISVAISEKLAERLKVVKVGDTLEVGFKSPYWGFWDFRVRPRVTITLPDLRGLELSGACTGTVKGFKSSGSFEADISGASTLEMDMQTGNFKADISGAGGVNGNLTATSSDIQISGAGRITLTGTGGNANIDASGASQVYLGSYSMSNGNIDFSGGSFGTVNASGTLNADISGGSRLDYVGNPTLGKINITGGSSFKAK